MKAELLGGFVMVIALVVVGLLDATADLRWLGGQTALNAVIAALALGTVVALGRTVVASHAWDRTGDDSR